MKVGLYILGICGLFFSSALLHAACPDQSKDIHFEAVVSGEDLTELELILKKEYLRRAPLEFRDQIEKLLKEYWALYLKLLGEENPDTFKIIKVFDKNKFVGFFSFTVFKGFAQRIISYENDPKKYKTIFNAEEFYVALHASPLQEGYGFIDQLIPPYLKAQYPACKKVYGSASAYFPDSVKRFESLGFKKDADFTQFAIALSEEGVIGYSFAL